jgi:hypothetical protein
VPLDKSTREKYALLASDRCKSISGLFALMAGRVATGDALECEGALDIMEQIEKEIAGLGDTVHILARGKTPEDEQRGRLSDER